MPATRDQAVCTRHWDWSETSQTVSLFTRSAGIVRGIAKGAKREKSPYSGGIDLLTRGEVVAIIKPGSELATITAWDLQESFPALSRSLPAFYAAMYLADLTNHALHDRDPHPALFDALVQALRDLDQPDATPVVLKFQWTTLLEGGWRPELERDVVSGAPLGDAPESGFAPSLGGFTLQATVGHAAPGPIWRVRRETLNLLRRLASGESFAPGIVHGRAARLLNAYLAAVLGREIPTAGAVFGTTPR